MKVRFEYSIRTEEKELSGGYGERALKDPIMIYSQIPIEKSDYEIIKKYCAENKITIYNLLENALEDAKQNY